jgi:GTP-binding protein
MLPVVALVGRPNVGKSTLFNVLTRSRDALVADLPGVTRDRHYGICRQDSTKPFVIIDTGGLVDDAQGLAAQTAAQVDIAIAEADAILLIVDARDGLLPTDRNIVDRLRRAGKPLILVVNKVDGVDENVVLGEFAALGIAATLPVSAAHSRGITPVLNVLLPQLPAPDEADATGTDEGIRVAIVGRPNVGKSTLVNRLLGEERVIASEVPGTTRDSLRIALERDGRKYTLIDTAGIRRRARVEDALEKFSVIKALQSVEASHVTVLMLDATEGVADQDATLIGHVLQSNRALVIAVNKWDGLNKYQRDQCKSSLSRKLEFVPWARQIFISAKHGTGVGDLIKAVDRAYASANRKFTSSDLTRALEAAYEGYQPPLVRGHAPKLRYAHPGGANPPTIVIHGSRTKHIADGYRRYLENFFRKRYKLEGTPVRIDFAEKENPYADKRNVLTEGQQQRRQKLIRRVKRSKR